MPKFKSYTQFARAYQNGDISDAEFDRDHRFYNDLPKNTVSTKAPSATFKSPEKQFSKIKTKTPETTQLAAQKLKDTVEGRTVTNKQIDITGGMTSLSDLFPEPSLGSTIATPDTSTVTPDPKPVLAPPPVVTEIGPDGVPLEVDQIDKTPPVSQVLSQISTPTVAGIPQARQDVTDARDDALKTANTFKNPEVPNPADEIPAGIEDELATSGSISTPISAEVLAGALPKVADPTTGQPVETPEAKGVIRRVDDFIRSPKGGMLFAQIALATTQQGSSENQLAATMFQQFQNQASLEDRSLLTPEQRTEQDKLDLEKQKQIETELTGAATRKEGESRMAHLRQLDKNIGLQMELDSGARQFTLDVMDQKQFYNLELLDNKLAGDIAKMVTLGTITEAEGKVMRKENMQDQIKLAQFNHELQKSLLETKSAVEREQLATKGWADQQKLYNATSKDTWDRTSKLHATAITADSYVLEDRALIVKEYADQMDGYLNSAVQSGGMSLQHANSLQTQQIYQVLTQAYPGAQVSQPKYTENGPIFKIIYTPTRGNTKGIEQSIILDARGNTVK